MNAPIAINCLGVGKTYTTRRGRVEGVCGITLEIERGEFFVLLGPSGCGKSTLLNLIAGLDRPSLGSIFIEGRTVVNAGSNLCEEPAARGIGMVFQSYALYPHMTVEKNIAFPLTTTFPRPSKESIRSKVLKTAAFLQIGDLLSRKPAELSGGQKQRVAIGRALVREPRVLLMDEPLSNLDAQLRTAMRTQLKEIQRRLGLTVVFVTHDQTEAMTLGDRIAVLKDGRIQQVADPLTLYDKPATVFVATFLGTPPMNIFTGRVVAVNGSVMLDADGSMLPLPATARLTNGTLVTVGVRPEHIDILPSGEGHLEAEVSLVEHLGAETVVHLRTRGRSIAVRSFAPYPSGREVSLRFHVEKMREFGAEGVPGTGRTET